MAFDATTYHREWRLKNAEKYNEYQQQYQYNYKHLQRYGLSVEDYNKLFLIQDGCCAICSRHQSEFKRRLAVDHCHETGTIRGLLCTNCNTAIGMLKEDTEVLEAAIAYIERYRENGQ